MMKSALRKPGQEPTNDKRHQFLCFNEIEIFEFPLILGDNPFCEGAPVQLDWDPVSDQPTILDVDYYEFTHKNPRPKNLSKHQTKKQYHLSTVQREIFLLKQGYTLDELVDACARGRKIRKERLASMQTNKWMDRFRVVMESAKGKMRRSKSLPEQLLTTDTVLAQKEEQQPQSKSKSKSKQVRRSKSLHNPQEEGQQKPDPTALQARLLSARGA